VLFQSWPPDKVSLAVNAAHNGLLVLSEVWYPGWRATVNGRPAEIYKTDGSLRGIVVPAGSSQVALSFQPMSFYLGASLTLATFVCVLAGRLWLRLTAFQIS
jgi:uncharacterized membrane protein YfhO